MYLVKVIATATEKNRNFAGIVNEYLYGKDQKLLGYKDEYLGGYKRPYQFMVDDYGYRRECDAKKSWIFRNTKDTEFWKNEVLIIKV